jgi:uncharacterized protein YndB with AHSA1/START domain
MGPVSAEVEIDAPRERAFEAIGDLSRRPSFTDHFLEGFHLTRIDSSGIGAGARFRLRQPPRSIWMDTAIAELDPLREIVERGRGGRGNRIPVTTVWELREGAGSLVRVRVSQWAEPAGRLDKALEKLVGASLRTERDWREALRRLRELLESERPATEAALVAGGGLHASGIP